MKVISTVVVDDEELARKRVIHLLKKDKEIQVVASCENGEEAVKIIREKRPDLIFLDIQMPEVGGFDVLNKVALEGYSPTVVFITAHDQYALRAFEVRAADYLLKPFDEQRFFKALQRSKRELRKNQVEMLREKMNELINELGPSPEYLSRIMVKTSDRVRFLKVEEIDWIEASGNYVCIYSDGKKYLIRETMNNMEAKLNPDHFFRVHRSTIINLNKVKELEQWYHGDYLIVMEDGKKLTMSRNYKDLLQRF